MTTKKDLIIALIVGEIIAWLIWPVWMNLGIFQNYWQWRWVLLTIMPVLCVIGVLAANFIGKWIKIFNQFFRYGLIGVLNTLLDFGVLNLLSYTFKVYSGFSLVLINVVSFLISNINSYFWNKSWTFESQNKKVTGEFLRFFGVTAIGFLINSAILWAGTTLIEPILGLATAMWENVVKLVATVVYIVWNFIGYKLIVFKEKPTNEISA